MNYADKMGFVEQARSELQQRIKQTNNICERFKNSAGGYSSNIPQIILLFFLVTVVSVSVWAVLNADLILNIFSTQDYERDSMLVKTALLGVCFYITLHMIKKIIRIIRIAKIDGHVFKVRNIENYLQTNLNKLSSIAAEADKRIFGNVNVKLDSKYDVDADIAKYSNIVKIYSNPNDSVLKTSLTLTHWLSGLFFMIAFLIISTSFVAELIRGQLVKDNVYVFICFLYVTVLMVLYMIFQELFAGNSVFRMPKRGKHIIIGLIIGGGIGGGIGFLIGGINGAVIGSIIGLIISSLIGGGFFSSDTFISILAFFYENGLIFIFIVIGAVIGAIIGGFGIGAGSGAGTGAVIGVILGAISGVISGEGCAGFFYGAIIGAIVVAIIGAIIGGIANSIDGSNGIITCTIVGAIIFGVVGAIFKHITK